MKLISDALEMTRNVRSAVAAGWNGVVAPVFVLLVALAVLWALISTFGLNSGYTVDWDGIAIFVLTFYALYGLGLVVTFFGFFRGISAKEQQLNNIITYCYAFIVFSLSISIVPFVALPLMTGLDRVMQQSQMGMVAGCVVTPKSPDVRDDAADQAVPRELRCGYNTDQWVINLGGTVTRQPGSPPAQVQPGSKHPDPVHVQISGGLVVPLYAVVLSLMGAVVSMTRRVPEIQRRLSLDDPEHISNDQAREMLVFQIMQVVSAPLIVLTAYYLIAPNSRATTIVLSFASGFSSETVLLFIRASLEKVKPAPSITSLNQPVLLSHSSLEFGKVAVGQAGKKTITIRNAGSTPLEITGLVSSGEFNATTNTPMPMSIAAGASGFVDVEFKPQSAGSKAMVLSIVAKADGFPRSVELTGIGIAA
jgi:hypothetical protein